MEMYLFWLVLSLLWLWAACAVYLVTAPTRYEEDEENADDKPRTKTPDLSTTIVVLGDIGRSPRMQYHAISLAKHGAKVEIVGYSDSEIHPQLKNNPLVTVRNLAGTPWLLRLRSRFLLPFILPAKALHQALNVYYNVAVQTSATRYVLLQNPPSIPTMLIAIVATFIRNQRLIIDWHNLGFSVLALTLGESHILVRIAKAYELRLARYAWAHFAVTAAMAQWLRKNAGITAPGQPLVLHDRPAETFKPFRSATHRADFLKRLPETKEFSNDIVRGRWRLVVSSTSWSDDEDFSLLLEGLVGYCSKVNVDGFLAKGGSLPRLLVVITGKGPRKDFYLDRIKALNQEGRLEHVLVRTAWLSSEDYASLLAAADLGVSLHQSTSGIDLPMKVVDMFGAGLPVAGYSKFEAWPELVREGDNGLGFETSEQLQDILVRLMGTGADELMRLKQGAVKEGQRRWDDEWDAVAGKLLLSTA